MRTWLATTWHGLTGTKSEGVAARGSWGLPIPDRFRRKEPSPRDLLAELRSTAWTCASLNASVCAAYAPRLFVRTSPGQTRPKCATRPLDVLSAKAVAAPAGHLVEEVTEHPLLTLFAQVNETHNAFDLWELTTLYQECIGSCYWLLEWNDFTQTPDAIYVLPAHLVVPRRERNSTKIVDYYDYEGRRIDPSSIIHFRYPDPRDPYGPGLSPLRACYSQACVVSEHADYKLSRYENHGIPDAIVSPDEVIGEEELERLETRWQQKMRRRAGRVLFAESALKVNLLNHSQGDLAALTDIKASKEEVANAFGVPLSYLSSDTNLANLVASERQHAAVAIRPRLRRRDEKINEQLIPLYDPTGRLFLASPDPVSEDRAARTTEDVALTRAGIKTINECRAERGLPPAPWGDEPLATVRVDTDEETP